MTHPTRRGLHTERRSVIDLDIRMCTDNVPSYFQAKESNTGSAQKNGCGRRIFLANFVAYIPFGL
jgi:hypothetical protein